MEDYELPDNLKVKIKDKKKKPIKKLKIKTDEN